VYFYFYFKFLLQVYILFLFYWFFYYIFTYFFTLVGIGKKTIYMYLVDRIRTARQVATILSKQTGGQNMTHANGLKMTITPVIDCVCLTVNGRATVNSGSVNMQNTEHTCGQWLRRWMMIQRLRLVIVT